MGCTTDLPEYKALAVAARKLQRHCNAADLGDGLRNAFAVLDQALIMLGSNTTCGAGDVLVPLLVPQLLAPRALAFVDSLATHATHCAMANKDVHFAQSAVQCVRGNISLDQADRAKRIHQHANRAKHDGLLQLGQHILDSTNPQFLPPPAPPPLPGLHSAIACADLEAFRFSLFGPASRGFGDIDGTSVCTPVDNFVSGILIDEASMVFTVGESDLMEGVNKGSAATCLVDMGSTVTGTNDDDQGSKVTATIDSAGTGPNNKGVVTEPIVDNISSCQQGQGHFVTDPNDNNAGSTVTDLNDSASSGVTDIIDMDQVTDIIDKDEANACSKYADLIDRNSKGLRLLQVQAACNPGNDELVAQARVACCSHRQLLRMLMVQQGASNSIIAAFNAVCLYISTFSSKHRMKKYKFYRTFKLRPRPIVKPHPQRQLPKYWVGCLPNLHASASVLPSIKDELYFYLLKRELEFVELGRSHPRRTQTEKQRYSKAISALDIWHILEKTGR